MKTAIPFTTMLAGVASMAIAPALNERVEGRHTHSSTVGIGPTVDGTSTRGQWVTSYSNDKGEAPSGPTVDGTSTRGQWVTSYANNKGGISSGPTVDETSTRGKWVSSYTGKGMIPDHWLPSGPGYLEVDSLEKGYHAHLLIMHDSKSWLQSGMLHIRHFFHTSAI